MEEEYSIDREFHKNLQKEDDLGVVIRTHISIEQSLNKLLDLLCSEPTHLKPAKLEYNEKVCLALALGLTHEYGDALKGLGSLRNNFAHKSGMTLDNSNTTNFYNSFSPSAKNILQQTYSSTKKSVKNSSLPKTLKKLPPRDKFIVMAVTLHSLIRVGISIKERNLENGELHFRCKCGKFTLVPLEYGPTINWFCKDCNKEYQFEYKFGSKS